MDFDTLKDWGIFALTAIGGILGWCYRKVKEDVESNSKELSDYKLYVANNYVNRLDLSEAMGSIKESMVGVAVQLNSIQLDLKDFTNRFTDKLDRKQDKS